MIDSIASFFQNAGSWVRGSVSLSNLIEIIILSVCIYYIILWFKKTKAWTLMKGIVIILMVMLLAVVFELKVISAILQSCFSVGIIAIIILFQPELRRALEQLGRKRLIQSIFSFDDHRKDLHFSDESLDAIIDACYEMGSTRTGALIVMENETPLGEYEKTGIPLDAHITSQLLIQIFEKNTPLHDGAIIIRFDRIVAATCYLPVSANMQISKSLGTRHRAGLGISEVSDSVTIIVSEETGKVSLAIGGEIIRGVTRERLRQELEKIQNKPQDNRKKWGFRGRSKNEKDTAE
jgi:diadenylate cyclase